MVGGTISLVPGVTNSRYFVFFLYILHLSTCALGTYQQPWLELSAGWMVDEVVAVFTLNIYTK